MTIKINTKTTNSADVYAGEQLKKRRKELKLTQKELAEKVGVTFQQIQKYEKGINRIGTSRLFMISTVLKVAPSYFFKNIEFEKPEKISKKVAENNEIGLVTELVLYFKELDKMEDKRKILDYIKKLAKESKEKRD